MEAYHILFFIKAVLSNIGIMYLISNDLGQIWWTIVILSLIYFLEYFLWQKFAPKDWFGYSFEADYLQDSVQYAIPIILFLFIIRLETWAVWVVIGGAAVSIFIPLILLAVFF